MDEVRCDECGAIIDCKCMTRGIFRKRRKRAVEGAA